MNARIYLDHNATSPLRPEALAAMQEAWQQPANASSMHAEGRRAHALLEDARRSIAEAIGAFPKEIYFTSSATEANNWVLGAFPARKKLVAASEHVSVLHAADRVIPVDAQGLVDRAALEALLREHTGALVSVMLANNETGVIQPIAEIAALAHAHGALLHTDAVQAVGRISIDAGLLQADFITLAGHKSGAPVGAAALVARGGMELAPLLKGGSQEQRRRAGTENIAAICGFAKVLELPVMHHVSAWRDALEATLPQAVVFGKNAPRMPNTACLAMPGVPAETQLMHFDLSGIAISAGSACTSGKISASHVLSAMGVPPELATTAIRVSLGWNSTQADAMRFAEAWNALRGRILGQGKA